MSEDDKTVELYSKITEFTGISKESKKLYKIPKTANWSFGAGLQAGILFIEIKTLKADRESRMKHNTKWTEKIIQTCIKNLIEGEGFQEKDIDELLELLGHTREDLS